jgi:hypothetical protein
MVHRCPYCNPAAYETGLQLQQKGGRNTEDWAPYESGLFCTLCGAPFAVRDSGSSTRRGEFDTEELLDFEKKEPFVSQVRSGEYADDKVRRKRLYQGWLKLHEASRKWQKEIFKQQALAEQHQLEAKLGMIPTRDVEEAMRWLTCYDNRLWNEEKLLNRAPPVRRGGFSQPTSARASLVQTVK